MAPSLPAGCQLERRTLYQRGTLGLQNAPLVPFVMWQGTFRVNGQAPQQLAMWGMLHEQPKRAQLSGSGRGV